VFDDQWWFPFQAINTLHQDYIGLAKMNDLQQLKKEFPNYAELPGFLNWDQYWQRCKSMRYTTGFARRQQGRICHAEPNGGQGVLTTLPIVIEEDTLVLNAAVPCSGSLQVEILDDQGQPISGFEKANCHPIEGDSIEHEVHWKNGQLKALQGTPVLLRFLLGNAKLYSYQMW
jgi:hypothetical protein